MAWATKQLRKLSILIWIRNIDTTKRLGPQERNRLTTLCARSKEVESTACASWYRMRRASVKLLRIVLPRGRITERRQGASTDGSDDNDTQVYSIYSRMVLSILPHFCPAYLLQTYTPPSITLRSNMPSIRAIEQMGCLEAKRSPCNRQNKTNKPTISK